MKSSLSEYFLSYRAAYRATWLGWIVIVIALVGFTYLSRQIWFDLASSIITAKDTSRKAEVVVFECWEYPEVQMLRTAYRMKEQGMAGKIFFVEYLPSENNTMMGINVPKHYREMLGLYFESVGYDMNTAESIPFALKDPVTLNTALAVTDTLAKRGYKSMLLLSPWYHSERSKRSYEIAAKRHDMLLFCKPIESGLNRDNWWKTHSGMTRVGSELVKLVYYWFSEY